MILKTFLKQPSELKDYDIEFSPWLTPINDTLDDIEVEITCLTDPNDLSLQLVRNEMTLTRYKIWLKGGTDTYQYKVTLTARTVGGRIDESELIFAIGDF